MSFELISEKIDALSWRLSRLEKDNEELRVLLGRVAGRISSGAGDPVAAEFRVFSQFGEDGILSWILDRVEIERKVFVEFGVENYAESEGVNLVL